MLQVGKALLDSERDREPKAKVVVAWATRVHNQAAAIFSRSFFEKLGNAYTLKDAFESACSDLESLDSESDEIAAAGESSAPPSQYRDARSIVLSAGAKFTIADPDAATAANNAAKVSAVAAGIPMLLERDSPDCQRWLVLGNWMKTQKGDFEKFKEPVSGDDLSIVEHCVPLRVLSGKRFDKMMAEVSDMDCISDREMQRRRNNIGALYDDDADDETKDPGADAEEALFACVAPPRSVERQKGTAILQCFSGPQHRARPRSCTSCIIAVCTMPSVIRASLFQCSSTCFD